jgi:predicted RNA polymerase sigma factor
LFTTARRRLIDRARHERVRSDAAPTLRLLERGVDALPDEAVFPDDRLKLLFVCAHPAIDRGVHTALMLQVVLGLDAATIAPAFLVAPATMGQRLSRAKRKIRDAGIAFEVPDRHQLASRLEAVLDAIYTAYNSGWDDIAGADPRRRGLSEEAIWLARVLVAVMPDEAEALGLLAVMLFCEARRLARRPDGVYVPMSDQDVRLWSMPMIDDAERVLAHAGRGNRPGRFQLEAALQSAHVEGTRRGRVDWDAIAVLYTGLLRFSPAVGAQVGRAAAIAEARGPAAGLDALDGIERSLAETYQPYWAVRAHILARLGNRRAAAAAFDIAMSLTDDEAIRAFLRERRSGSDPGI